MGRSKGDADLTWRMIMARLGHFESEFLRFTTQVDVAIPEYGFAERQAGIAPEELFERTSCRDVSISWRDRHLLRLVPFQPIEERRKKKFIVVCPTAQNSCYQYGIRPALVRLST